MSLRRSLVLVALAAVLCSLLGSPAQARVAADDPELAVLRRPREPWTTCAACSTARRRRTRRAAAARGADPGHGARRRPDHGAGDLAVHQHELTGADLAEAESYLARPTDPDGPGNPDRAYSVAEATPVCEGAICVHYVPRPTTPRRSPTTRTRRHPRRRARLRRPRAVDDPPRPRHVRRRGLSRAQGRRFPWRWQQQDRLYIADIGDDGLYGYCDSDQTSPSAGPSTPGPTAWSTTTTPPRVPDPHRAGEPPGDHRARVFHAVQFGYDIAEDSWFLEATAAWVEDEMYDDVNDNLQYLKQSPLRLPRVPMDTFGGASLRQLDLLPLPLRALHHGGRAADARPRHDPRPTAEGAPDYYSMQAVKWCCSRGTDFENRSPVLRREPAAGQTYRRARPTTTGRRRWSRSTAWATARRRSARSRPTT